MVESLEQIPFPDPDFVVNSEPRCPCILLLDTSSSMKGNPIEQLNDGLITFKDELVADSLAAKRVEIALVTFGPVRVFSDFQLPEYFQAPAFDAAGETPMGQAIEESLEMLRQRKIQYKQNGISYYRPWVFLITDGAPTDEWRHAATLVQEGEERNAFSFFAIGVEGADMSVLKQISIRQPVRLREMRFRDFFIWLTGTLKTATRTNPGDRVVIENPAAPDGWAVV
ncbi:MAG: vWA domain-containing protein [Candidatus Binatia bacterium]